MSVCFIVSSYPPPRPPGSARPPAGVPHSPPFTVLASPAAAEPYTPARTRRAPPPRVRIKTDFQRKSFYGFILKTPPLEPFLRGTLCSTWKIEVRLNARTPPRGMSAPRFRV